MSISEEEADFGSVEVDTDNAEGGAEVADVVERRLAVLIAFGRHGGHQGVALHHRWRHLRSSQSSNGRLFRSLLAVRHRGSTIPNSP